MVTQRRFGWKRIFLGILLLLILLFVVYKILSSITRYPVDKSVEITAPASPKSKPEYYAFGYQPAVVYTEQRAVCNDRSDTKRAMFGDLHIHTALSSDAFPDGTRTFPDAAYRFAQGEAIELPTPTGQTRAQPRSIQIDRPLDFAAVTDHAGTFGEGYICRTRGAFAGYDSDECASFRAGGEDGVRAVMGINGVPKPERNPAICGTDGKDCEAADRIVWKQIQDYAENAYDRSASCKFTSFVGYEYTRAPNAQHKHRNTIFRNAQVPERAASFVTHPANHQLLSSFEKECRLGLKNCDVISIPHNSNISGGNAFNHRYTEGFSEQSQAAYAQLRASYDRLAEIIQHKGASECLNRSTDVLGDVDELCDVEAIRQFGKEETAIELFAYLPALSSSNSPECDDSFFDPADNLYKGFCLSSRDFARGALLYGMDEERKKGINPFEFGFIGSTDTHISAAGGTDEATWKGHIAYETDLTGRLEPEAGLGRFNRLMSNPGGLAGVYATENSRDAIFQSMKRREAFATSGTRIEPRFFAGRYPDNICVRPDWLSMAYRGGTPMGSKLAAQDEPFQLLIQAKRDPRSNPLQKIQLIKGWIDAEFKKRYQVIELKAQAKDGQLCALYSDPDYDANAPTYYYMRAVETPSLRWSARQCDALAAAKRPALCQNDYPRQINEMAWSSPIWFTPGYLPALPVDGAAVTEHGHP